MDHYNTTISESTCGKSTEIGTQNKSTSPAAVIVVQCLLYLINTYSCFNMRSFNVFENSVIS